MPDNKVTIVSYKLVKGFTFFNILIQLFFSQQPMAQSNDTTNPYSHPLIKTTAAYQACVQHNPTHAMVDLKKMIPDLTLELVYCSAENFTGQVLYPALSTSYLRLAAAEALKSIQMQLKREGLSLKIWDAYRPYQVTRKMWQVVPDARYAADPAVGSGHNRGIAVDLTLINTNTGRELDMGTEFDNFTERAHHDYASLPENILAHRKKLRQLMEANGFKALETEWWHYSWSKGDFELMDFTFQQLQALCEEKSSYKQLN